MKKIDLEEIVDIISPEVAPYIGNDDFVFGNYIEWPSLETLDTGTFEALLECFDLQMEDDEENRTDMIEKLKSLGVPSGMTMYENEYNYPESCNYFMDEDPELDEYFEPLAINVFISRLSDLKKELDVTNNNLIKRALILTMMILTESFAMSTARKNANILLENVKDKELKKYIENKLDADSKTDGGRKEIFNRFIDEQVNSIPVKELRNILAHDIDDAEINIDGDDIQYPVKNGRTNKIAIKKLYDQLIKYANDAHLKDIDRT